MCHLHNFIVPLLGIVRESTDGSISLINVPIVTPNCEVIVPSLTVHVSTQLFHTYICYIVTETYCVPVFKISKKICI